MEASKDAVVEQNQAQQEETKSTSTDASQQKKLNTKHEKEKKKQERLAARQKKTVEEEYKKDPNDPSAHLFGELELNRSQSNPDKRYERKFVEVHNLDETFNGQEVLVRGRLHTSRATGKNCFIVLRE